MGQNWDQPSSPGGRREGPEFRFHWVDRLRHSKAQGVIRKPLEAVCAEASGWVAATVALEKVGDSRGH